MQQTLHIKHIPETPPNDKKPTTERDTSRPLPPSIGLLTDEQSPFDSLIIPRLQQSELKTYPKNEYPLSRLVLGSSFALKTAFLTSLGSMTINGVLCLNFELGETIGRLGINQYNLLALSGLIAAGSAALWFGIGRKLENWARRISRTIHSQCEECDYPRKGWEDSNKCPECGEEQQYEQKETT